MKRVTLNFIIACVGFVLFVSMVATGTILRYILPCGRGYGWRGGRGAIQAGQNIKEFWLMTRPQWLDIHFWIAVAFVTVIIMHIMLHWDWIKSYVECVTKPAPKLLDGGYHS